MKREAGPGTTYGRVSYSGCHNDLNYAEVYAQPGEPHTELPPEPRDPVGAVGATLEEAQHAAP